MFNYEKCLKKAQAKHWKQELKWMKYRGGEIREFKWSLPYYKTLGIFKQPNGRVTFNPTTIEARSYNHWCFVKVIKGKVVFNEYSYSITTRKHQNKVSSLLDQLGIKIDVTVCQSQSLDQGIVLDTLYGQIYKIEISSQRKGARQTTKLEAPKLVKELKEEIQALKKLGGKTRWSLKEIKGCVVDNEQRRLERAKRKYEQWKLDNAHVLVQRKVDRESEKFHEMVNS